MVDGPARLTFVGTGTGVPGPRGAPCLALASGNTTMLLDLGPGALWAARARGIDPTELDACVLTHLHLDHTSDLAALLFALRNPVISRVRPLRVMGPEGTAALVQGMVDLFGVSPRGFALMVEEVRPGYTIQCGPFRLVALAVEHKDVSLGYRVDHGERRMFYSGDSGPCEGLVRGGRGVHTMVLEASFVGNPFPGHLTASQAGEMAARAKPELLVLTHIYPGATDRERLVEACASFHGPVLVAHDGLELAI